jgi:hypothetical protein
VLSGQKANVQIVTSRNYVIGLDYDRARPLESLADAEPLIGNVPEGLTLDVQAVAEGDEAVLTCIEATLSGLVEMCTWEARAAVGGRATPVYGGEPIVLTRKSRLPTPCRIRLKVDEAVVVPIQPDSLVVKRSNMRALVKHGKARMMKDPTARFLARLDERGYPAKRAERLFFIITARVASEEAPKAKAS